MATNKDIKYLNKNFDTFKTKLIDYSKTYFPNSYNDFTPESIGMLFMEMSSYVGDVLSFYLYASAKVDGEWKVFAKANNLIIRFQETSAINFQILENISGNVSGLYLGYSQYGVGTYTNVYNNTSFVFSNIATPTTPVPEPSTYGMMLIGLFFIGYMRRSRKQAAYLPL